MLVLSRRRDETIMIGDDVELTVVDIRGDKVRLGITAPIRITVHRKEIYDAIRRENEAAARLNERDAAGLPVPVNAHNKARRAVPAAAMLSRPAASSRRSSAQRSPALQRGPTSQRP